MKPNLVTCLSPSLLHLYDVSDAVVVVIDVFRATSTIASALHNGAAKIIPVDSVANCIAIGQETGGLTAGERDGKIVEGLMHGNSPLEYPKEFIAGKTLVLTTTNGTKLLHMALAKGADSIITGSFPNMEDTLFAGAVVNRIKSHFTLHCDASLGAEALYNSVKDDMWPFIQQTTHYHRLAKYGLEKDMKFCITADAANVLPIYTNGALLVG